jgi:hypothetical protein
MDICNQIQRERRGGRTKCGIIDSGLSLAEVARAFELSDDIAIYRFVARAEADAIVTHVLQADLACGKNIMTSSRANELWWQFLERFEGQEVRFATNVSTGLQSWNAQHKRRLTRASL